MLDFSSCCLGIVLGNFIDKDDLIVMFIATKENHRLKKLDVE